MLTGQCRQGRLSCDLHKVKTVVAQGDSQGSAADKKEQTFAEETELAAAAIDTRRDEAERQRLKRNAEEAQRELQHVAAAKSSAQKLLESASAQAEARQQEEERTVEESKQRAKQRAFDEELKAHEEVLENAKEDKEDEAGLEAAVENFDHKASTDAAAVKEKEVALDAAKDKNEEAEARADMEVIAARAEEGRRAKLKREAEKAAALREATEGCSGDSCGKAAYATESAIAKMRRDGGEVLLGLRARHRQTRGAATFFSKLEPQQEYRAQQPDATNYMDDIHRISAGLRRDAFLDASFDAAQEAASEKEDKSTVEEPPVTAMSQVDEAAADDDKEDDAQERRAEGQMEEKAGVPVGGFWGDFASMPYMALGFDTSKEEDVASPPKKAMMMSVAAKTSGTAAMQEQDGAAELNGMKSYMASLGSTDPAIRTEDRVEDAEAAAKEEAQEAAAQLAREQEAQRVAAAAKEKRDDEDLQTRMEDSLLSSASLTLSSGTASADEAAAAEEIQKAKAEQLSAAEEAYQEGLQAKL